MANKLDEAKVCTQKQTEATAEKKTGQSYVCLYLNDMQDIVVNIRRGILTANNHIHTHTHTIIRSLSMSTTNIVI